MKKSELRTALLISGGGTTAEAVIKACQNHELTGILPIAVISSREEAGGIEKAKRLGIKTYIIERKDFTSGETFGNELLRILQSLNVDLISQNGWLPLTPENVIEAYEGRIINQHPGPLDPGRNRDFGGKGMYGARVTCTRVAYSWLIGSDFWTESTTHFVTEQYDKGDLIRVMRMDFESVDDHVTIAQLMHNPKLKKHLQESAKKTQRILLPLEHQNVIGALRLFTEGKVEGFKRETALVAPSNWQILKEAKKIAIQLFPDG